MSEEEKTMKNKKTKKNNNKDKNNHHNYNQVTQKNQSIYLIEEKEKLLENEKQSEYEKTINRRISDVFHGEKENPNMFFRMKNTNQSSNQENDYSNLIRKKEGKEEKSLKFEYNQKEQEGVNLKVLSEQDIKARNFLYSDASCFAKTDESSNHHEFSESCLSSCIVWELIFDFNKDAHSNVSRN